MEKMKREPKVEEFKDSTGENRIRVTAQNGNILDSSPQGYKNISDCRDMHVTSAIAILKKYNPNFLNPNIYPIHSNDEKEG